MQSSKRTVSPFLYFILISSLTNLVFLLIGLVGLALFSIKFSGIGLLIIVFLLIWKGALVGFVSWFSHKKFSHKKANNKDFWVKFIGTYLGRFFGILIGGFLGYEIADAFKQSNFIGFVVGALAFYFAGRWTGSKISTLIGTQLDKVVSIPESQVTGNVVDTKSAGLAHSEVTSSTIPQDMPSKATDPTYPCPCCGFIVFNEPSGSYDICPICGWEDDHVQLAHPDLRGGANHRSLIECQKSILEKIPEDIQERQGYKRLSSWRPLEAEDCVSDLQPPQTGSEYFIQAGKDSPSYYWEKN